MSTDTNLFPAMHKANPGLRRRATPWFQRVWPLVRSPAGWECAVTRDAHRAGATRVAALVGLLASALLAGCATALQPDPIEPWNRGVFDFNEAVDGAVVAPVARGYVKVVPQVVRTGVRNFFANPQDIGSAINLLLQGRPKDALSDVARVVTNSTLGVLGLIDVATPLGLERHGEDFGQTLGRWGAGPGAYIVWPILGPSTVRDTAGIPVEMLLAPQAFVANADARAGLSVLQLTGKRAELLPATEMLDSIALDKYLFVRDAYLQRRRGLVQDGQAPQHDVAEPSVDAGRAAQF
ncbi:MlaA family lipoprotein [Variovorax sp. RT4R15]|uniref:MlaA family lipoprotein n=1 Tax=Variovorax sp. RT4R15 TaxID=3443737 RepID=UPI003F454C75